VRSGRLALLAATCAAMLAACGASGPTQPAPVSPAPVSPPQTSPTATQRATDAVIEDPALLSVLPRNLGDVPVTLEHQAFADALSDPAFVAKLASAAFAVVVSGEDLASGVVARPRPGVYSEAFFRDWRETYDAGACAQAGGVATHAEAEMGGQTIYIATCTGGLRTYHAYVEERGVIVSLFSLGDGRLGEQLMAGLRP